MVISLTLGILLGGTDAADSATRLVSLLPEAALDNENLLIAIGDLVGSGAVSVPREKTASGRSRECLVKLQMHTYDQCIDERISASFHSATTKPRPASLAAQCYRDNWIVDVVTGIESANLIEQLDIPHVDVQYLRNFTKGSDDTDLSADLPDHFIASRVDKGNTSCNIAPPFQTRWG